jgi:hypothetical protein
MAGPGSTQLTETALIRENRKKEHTDSAMYFTDPG